jgi:hypothetical protein
MRQSPWQRLCLAVLLTAIKDLGRGEDGAGYFFDERLHHFFCASVRLDYRAVTWLLIKEGLLAARSRKG